MPAAPSRIRHLHVNNLPVGVVMILTCLSCTTSPSACIWLQRVSQVSSAVTPTSRPLSLHAMGGGANPAQKLQIYACSIAQHEIEAQDSSEADTQAQSSR